VVEDDVDHRRLEPRLVLEDLLPFGARDEPEEGLEVGEVGPAWKVRLGVASSSMTSSTT
jgi:hypothetical protein